MLGVAMGVALYGSAEGCRQGRESGLEVDVSYLVLVMSEEQLKAAETEATAQVEDAVEEISEEDLAGVAGGANVNTEHMNIPMH